MYVATKAGVVALTRGFAKQFGPANITVNVISPGQIDTPMQHRDNGPDVVASAAHAWSSAIVSAASPTASFASPVCTMFEVKPLRKPMQHDLVAEPVDHLLGWTYPPTDKSGLGITIQDYVIERYRIR